MWAIWEIRKVIQQFVATKKLATKWTRINPQDSLQGLVGERFWDGYKIVRISGAFAHFLLEDTVDGSEILLTTERMYKTL